MARKFTITLTGTIPKGMTVAQVRHAYWNNAFNGDSGRNYNTVSVENGDPIVVEGDKAQHCAGALIMLERLGRPNQMMRISERLRLYDRTKLRMDAPVYDTPAAMIKAQKR